MMNSIKQKIKKIEKLYKENPDNIELGNMLACLYINTGQINEAISILEKFAKTSTEETREIILNNLGYAYLQRGSFQQAKDIFYKLLEENPKDKNVLCNLALVYSYEGKYEEAIQILERIPIEERTLEIENNLGCLYKNTGIYHKALEHFRRALEKYSDDVELLNNIGCTYKELQDIKNAIKYLEKSISIHPEDPIALYNLGICYMEAGENKKAIETFKKYLKFDSERCHEEQVKQWIEELEKSKS